MTARQYLNQCRVLNVQISARIERRASLEARSTYISPKAENANTGRFRASDKVGDSTVLILGVEAEIQELQKQRSEIMECVNIIEDIITRQVLFMYYGGGCSYRKISTALRISKDAVRQRLKTGISEIDKLFFQNT